ncbi:YDG domain-containing protein, partial [Flavobacterium sp.]|uniref:YDG domain-containing protein n=1 Tax=Flavobacterium sp. TaxID=239 RepID=UPI0037BF2BFA
MKNKLLFRKAVTQLFLSLCLMLFCTNTSWGQQVIGSYPVMDGGFEGQTNGALLITATSPAVNTTWTYGTDGTSSIVATGGRSGSKYAAVNVTTTSFGRQLISPQHTSQLTGSFVVQYYTRNAVNMFSIPVGVGATGSGYAGDGKNTTSTWTKVTQAVTSVASSIATSYGAFRTKAAAAGTAGFDVDDFVVYLGAADSTPPTAATAAVTPVDGTTVSWTAASGGVDGGGYMVVRYATNPNIDQDPNQNGIYAKNLSITNGTNGVSNPGTVVYIGTGTSFSDDVAGSSSGNDYYKIYTVDKAFNYSAELIATAVVSSTPAITSSTETLTGFNYTGTGPSASQSFVVTGSNLTANLVVSTASTNFELSSDDFATAGVASITLTGTTVASTTLYVRLKSNLAGGLKTGSVSVASTGANTLNSISLSGSVQAVYYYDGSGLLSSNTSWGANSNGTGTNPTAVTDTYANFVIANGNATTNASWTLGSNSKVIVGNGSAVSLTVADTFPIIGTIDAAANGSVVWQHVLTSPTFGTSLDNNSEVHFAPATAASYSFGATTAYGKLFIDGAGVVSVSNTASTPTVKTALTVASGSTLSFSSNANPKISINATATANINGKVITFRETGLFASTGSIPLIGAATLVLGTTSTIEFGRPSSAQAVTGLPTGVSYANLILSDGGSSSSAAKTIAAPFTVNGTLTINLATTAFSTISGANNITMANGATVVMTSGVLGAIPSFANGSKFNVTYNGNGKTQIVGATTASSTNVTLTSANAAIVAGMTVTGTAIPAGTTVASISGTALVLSAAATATSATPTLTFGTAVPQTTGVDLPTVANDALGDLTFDNTAGVVLSSAVKANNIITAKSNTITLNTADFLDANVQMNAGSELTLNVNANQANLKQILFSGATGNTSATTAKLKLSMTADTQVTFANSSAQNWGTGTIEITGFQEGKIKFGSSNSALTATQLGLIINTADLTKTFKLSDQGYLYYSTTLVPGDAIVVTSANPVFLAVGVASTYSITTTNSPTSFVLADPTNDPLPAGLTLNATTGAIEGTPTVSVTNFVVAITISNSVNTTNTIDFTFNVTIRDPQTITWSQDFPAINTYGDAAIALTATTDAPALSVSYSSSNTAVATISGSTLTIVGPGTTTIMASQAGNANYGPATNLTKELVVNTKVLTISGAVATGKIYDKTTTAAITGTLAGGLVGADVVTLVLSGTFADANAGIDKPVTSTSTLTGADATKYSLTQPSGLTATITKADQLLAALGTSSFKILGDADYDPIPLVTDSNVTLLPSVPVENPNFTYTSSNESVATIVGGKVHIVGLGSTTITGEQAGSINYNASLPVSQTLKVLPAPLAAWDLYSFNPTAGQQSVTSVNASEVAAGISVTPSLSMGNMAIITNAGNRYRFTSSDWPYAISSGTVAPINIATGKYMSVSIAADSGKSLSLSSINASFRGGAISSELLSQFAYSIDNGVTFTAIGSPTTFAGASGTRFYSDIDLSGIAALQNLPAGTTVILRYYASGKSNVTSSTAGQKAWGFFSDFVENNTRALIIGGTVVTVAPTASAQTFCASATVASLTATGTAIQWYAAATGGSALASDAVLASGNYYASQTLNGSESARTAVAVTFQAAPNAGTNGTLSLIASPSDADLFAALTGADAGGSWTRPSSGYVGVYTYTVNAISPCTVNATSTVTVSVSTLLPTADTTYNLCAGAKISNLLAAATASNGSVGVKIYAAATGGSPIVLSGTTDAVIPTSTTPKAYWLTEPASTPSGESARVRVFAVVNALPATPGTIAGTAAICNVVGSTTELTYSIASVVGATSYVWTVPTGANIVSGQDSTSVVVNFAGVAQGITALTLGVRSVNASGCLSVAKTLSLTRVLPVAPASVTLTNPASAAPATAITAVGPFIGTTTELTLTAAVTASANSYSWTLPAGVNVVSGNPATDRVLVINFANAAPGVTSITASVVSVSGCGNSIAKALVLTKVLPAKPATITTTQANVCLIAGSES